MRPRDSNLQFFLLFPELKVGELDPGFKGIELKSKYTDIDFGIPPELSASLTIEHSESTDIVIPESFTKIATETIDKKNDNYKTSGIIGDQSMAKAQINLSIRSGKVTFKDLNN